MSSVADNLLVDLWCQLSFKGASDLHLRVGEYPFVRINGELLRLQDAPLISGEILAHLIKQLINEEQLSILEQQGAIDLAVELSGYEVHAAMDSQLSQSALLSSPIKGSSGNSTGPARLRANIFKHTAGFGAVFRHIPAEAPSLNKLRLPAILKEICNLKDGLVLITGPTGSGKTTTLAAIIDEINEHRSAHIVTIEDPIEFIHKSKRSLVTQREIGLQVPNFSAALRAALREDPDIILVGEMRDQETMQLALTAAETGHLVLSTLHTSSAARTVDRIIDSFPAAQQTQVRSMLAESLSAVVAQRLVNKRDGGRVAVLEIMLATSAVRNLIREAKTHQLATVIQTSVSAGMQTMEMHLQELKCRGIIATVI